MTRTRIPLIVLCKSLIAAAALAFLACGSETPDRRATHKGGRALVDALGDTVYLERPWQRIVSLAPSVTELVYALGEQDRLVGVTDFCDYPAEAASKPRVAGFNTINLEAIVRARPDLVIASRGNLPEDLAAIRQVHIPVFGFEIESIPALLSGIETLGALLGNEERASRLRSSWQVRIGSVTAAVSRIPWEQRPRVFFGGMSEPVYSVGPGSFVHDLIVAAGGRNTFGDIALPWPRIDLETLVRRDPDVLLIAYMSPSDTAGVLQRLRTAPGWRSLSAVRKGNVAVLGDEVMRPGPRMVEALEKIHRALYPGESPSGGDDTR